MANLYEILSKNNSLTPSPSLKKTEETEETGLGLPPFENKTSKKIFQEALKKNQSGEIDKKIFDVSKHYLNKEEFLATEIEKHSRVPDLNDVISKFIKPFHALSSTVAQGIKDIKRGDFGFDPIPMKEVEENGIRKKIPIMSGNVFDLISAEEKTRLKSAFKRGWNLEERLGGRDVIREAAPGAVKFVEDNMSVNVLGEGPVRVVEALATGGTSEVIRQNLKLLGIKEFRVDPLTPAVLAYEVFADPITYIPFGSVPALIKQGTKLTSKSMRAISERVVGQEKTAKIISELEKSYIRNIAPYFSKRHIFNYYKAKRAGEKLIRLNEGAAAKSSFYLNDVMQIEKAGKTRLATKEEGVAIENFLRPTLDEFQDIARQRLADTWMVKVEDVVKIERLNTISGKKLKFDIDSDDYKKLVAEEQTILNSYKKQNVGIPSVEGNMANMIINTLFKKGGAGRVARDVAAIEYKTNLQIAKSRLKVAEQIRKEIKNANKIKHVELYTAAKSESQILSRMLNEDVKEIEGISKQASSEFDVFFKTRTKEGFNSLEASVLNLKTKIAKLDKYQFEITGSLAKSMQRSKSSAMAKTTLSKMGQTIKGLEIDIAKQQAGLLNKTMVQFVVGSKNTIKEINKQLGIYLASTKFQFGSIKKGLKTESVLQKEIIKTAKEKSVQIMKDEFQAERILGDERLLYSASLNKFKSVARNRMKDIEANLKILTSAKWRQDFYKKIYLEKMVFIDKELVDQNIPVHLRKPIKRMLEIYNLYGEKISRTNNPLVGGLNFAFSPRQLRKSMWKKFFDIETGAFKKAGSAVKKRTLLYERDYIKAMEEISGIKGITEDDAFVKLGEYIYNIERKLGKKVVEDAIIKKMGVSSKKNLPKELVDALDWVWDPTIKFKNPWIKNGFRAVSVLNSAMKWMLTIPNIAFNIRNVMGHLFLAQTTAGMEHAFNPSNMANASLLKYGKYGKNKTIGKYSFSYLNEKLFSDGFFNSGWAKHEFDAGRNIYKGNWKNPMTWVAKITQISMDLEDIGRLSAFFANLRAGKNINEAMEMARKSMFDYNLVSSPADKVLQGIFGFYVFSRRNIPQQVMGMLNEPRYYASLAKIIERVSGQKQLSEEEKNMMYSWEKSTFKFVGEVVDGVREMRGLGFLPTEEAYQTASIALSDDIMKGVANRMSPLGVFLDIYYDRETFTGRELSNSLPIEYSAILDKLPRKAIEAMGLTPQRKAIMKNGRIDRYEKQYFGDEKIIYAIRKFPPHARILGDIAKLAYGVQTGKSEPSTMKYLTGIKDFDLDIKKRRRGLEQKREQKIIDLIESKGASSFKVPYIPKSQLTAKEKWLKERKKKKSKKSRLFS